MNEYYPDRWMLVRVQRQEDAAPWYKVFAMWSGGYLTGDSWRLNSGIVKTHLDDGDEWTMVGESGTAYFGREQSYGWNLYGANVFRDLQKQLQEKYTGFTFEPITEFAEASAILKNLHKEN